MNIRETYSVQLQDPRGRWIDVGILRRLENSNWFQSLPSYWSRSQRATLGQVFEERGPSWAPNAHVALPRWFSHLLPEGQLREAVSAASKIKPQRELQLLARLGASDLPGAIRVLPADEDGEALPPEVVEEMYQEHSDENPVLKFSLAGLQMKFSVRQSSRGLTLPVSGEAGNFILKTPDQRPTYEGVPEAEYALMRLAYLSGIDTASVQLVDTQDVTGIGRWAEVSGRSLLVARYDRRSTGSRVHAEEFAQVLDIPTGRAVDSRYRTANFETIANYAANLSGVASVEEVIKRIVLNVLGGNGDAHLKNWSFTYPDGVHPQLSPAYDLVPTVLFVANDNLGLNLNQSKEFADVTPASFRVLGERSGYGAEDAEATAAQTVERVMSNWSVLSDILPASRMKLLNAHRDSLALLRA